MQITLAIHTSNKISDMLFFNKQSLYCRHTLYTIKTSWRLWMLSLGIRGSTSLEPLACTRTHKPQKRTTHNVSIGTPTNVRRTWWFVTMSEGVTPQKPMVYHRLTSVIKLAQARLFAIARETQAPQRPGKYTGHQLYKSFTTWYRWYRVQKTHGFTYVFLQNCHIL